MYKLISIDYHFLRQMMIGIISLCAAGDFENNDGTGGSSAFADKYLLAEQCPLKVFNFLLFGETFICINEQWI